MRWRRVAAIASGIDSADAKAERPFEFQPPHAARRTPDAAPLGPGATTPRTHRHAYAHPRKKCRRHMPCLEIFGGVATAVSRTTRPHPTIFRDTTVHRIEHWGLGSHLWGKSLRLQLIVNSLSQRPALLFDPFDNRGVLELPCQSLAFLLVPLTVIRPQPLQHLESASLCR